MVDKVWFHNCSQHSQSHYIQAVPTTQSCHIITLYVGIYTEYVPEKQHNLLQQAHEQQESSKVKKSGNYI